MLLMSIEAGKITRDRARLTNALNLSKSIQYYKMTYQAFPKSGPTANPIDLLLNEQILYEEMRDPLFISSTIKLDHTVDFLHDSYYNISTSLNMDTLNIRYNHLKLKALKYFNLTYNTEDTLDNESTFSITSIDSSTITVLPNSVSVFDSFPRECVIAYSSNNATDSYEISVCLESNFYKSKKKWDGGNDDNRYEIGSDLRLNTNISLNDNNQITSSDNTSIIK